jgi:hypothetical protein
VQEQRAVRLGERPLDQFFVCAMQRVARLEGNDVCAAQFTQPRAHFSRREPQFREIIVTRQLQHA